MIKELGIITILSLSLITCNNTKKNNKKATEITTTKQSKTTDIPFILAKNYFVKNSVKKIENPKIENVEIFNDIFGTATTMGENGKPTTINFSEQFIITVLKPKTDLQATIEVKSLQKNNKGGIVLTYKYKTGDKQSFTTRPNFIVIVDKSEKGTIALNEIN